MVPARRGVRLSQPTPAQLSIAKLSPLERVLRLFTGTWCWISFTWLTFSMVVWAPIAQALFKGPARRTAKRVEEFFWGKAFVWSVPFWKIRRTGLEHIGPGPYVVIANHSSVLDIPTVMGLPLPVQVLAKASLDRTPVVGHYIRWSGHVAIDVTDPEAVASSVDRLRAVLDQGVSVLIFPEGTRSPTGELGKFHRGAFRLSKDLGVPILPVAITGNYPLMPKHSIYPVQLRGDIVLTVLPPIDPSGFSTARKLSNHARRTLDAALNPGPSSP